MRKSFTAVGALSAGIILALAAPLSASAHVSVDASSTAAGSSTVLTFSVPHGCEGSSTTVVAIEIPQGIDSVTPTVNPNWTISRTTEPFEPAAADGSERTAQVVYTAATPLPADQRDTFELSLMLPEGEAGDVVEFPVLQTCEVGETLWSGEEVPAVVLTAAVEGDGHGHGAAEEQTGDESAHSEGAAPASQAADDVLARVLGCAGLVLGTIGLVLGITARRKAVK